MYVEQNVRGCVSFSVNWDWCWNQDRENKGACVWFPDDYSNSPGHLWMLKHNSLLLKNVQKKIISFADIATWKQPHQVKEISQQMWINKICRLYCKTRCLRKWIFAHADTSVLCAWKRATHLVQCKLILAHLGRVSRSLLIAPLLFCLGKQRFVGQTKWLIGVIFG